MSDAFRDGDVCEVVACCCAAHSALVGHELTIVSVNPIAAGVAGCRSCGFQTPAYFDVRLNSCVGPIPAAWIRKKPSNVDESQWIPQAVVPLERWNRWLKVVRGRRPVESPDEEHA